MSPSSKRVAAVDIGTNTVLLLVVEQEADGTLRPLGDWAEITRLGQGVDRTRRLDDEAVARTLQVLERYADQARSLGVAAIAAAATSASRDAANGEAFRQAALATLQRAAPSTVAVVSGEREAALTFRGALGGLPIASEQAVAVVDIGGGSSEIVLGDAGRVRWAHSFDIGSVRLTERYGVATPELVPTLRAAAREAFARVPVPNRQGQVAVGIAGTVTTFAAMALGLVDYASNPPHGYRMSAAQVEEWVTRLAAMPLEQRRSVAGLEPKRADVIVAGGAVVLEAMRAMNCSELVVSDRGVRWGLAAELAETTFSR